MTLVPSLTSLVTSFGLFPSTVIPRGTKYPLVTNLNLIFALFPFLSITTLLLLHCQLNITAQHIQQLLMIMDKLVLENTFSKLAIISLLLEHLT